MAKDIYVLAFELKDLLNNDPRITSLNKSEEEMANDQEVKDLVSQKEKMTILYESALNNNGEDSKEFKEARKALHDAKLALDTHPLVKQYLNNYSIVRDLYFNINEILFSNLNIHLKEHR